MDGDVVIYISYNLKYAVRWSIVNDVPDYIEKEIAEILERCNYSESFIKTANDLQVLDAINDCYEEYKILKRK